MIARTAIGTFSQKIEPHQKWFSSTPPTVGPATTPTIATIDQPAIALRCSCGGNTVNSSDSVLGISSAPPTPISPRHAINCPGFWASVASSEAAPKITSPRSSIFRRPNRSDRLPAVSNSPANARMYASITHWMSAGVASRSRISDGIARLSTVLSTTSTIRLRHRISRIHQRRGWPVAEESAEDSNGVLVTRTLYDKLVQCSRGY